MTEEGTLCINADVLKKVGSKANSTASAEAYTNIYIKEAEGFICTITRYDWVTNYASVSAIGKEILRDATSSYAALDVISYDLGAYGSLRNAETLLDINLDNFLRAIKLLKENNNYKDFILTGEGDIN